MSDRIHYTLCPLCSSSSIKNAVSVRDNTVSTEQFVICECTDCTIRFTQDVPDASAIGRYYKSENYISHSNTPKGLVNRLYRIVRSRALQQKRKLVERSTNIKKGDLLDVGSGTGAFAAVMKQSGWNVTALEPDELARDVAFSDHKIKLDPIQLFYELNERSFDAITLWHVLEHVHDLHGYVRQFKKILRPNGRLIIAVPNYTSFDAEVFKENWAAYDAPRHLYHFNPQSMERLMQLEQMSIIDIVPMWYDSFYVSLLSSRYKHGYTNWLSALWTGLLSNLKAMEKKERCSSLIYIIERNKKQDTRDK